MAMIFPRRYQRSNREYDGTLANNINIIMSMIVIIIIIIVIICNLPIAIASNKMIKRGGGFKRE